MPTNAAERASRLPSWPASGWTLSRRGSTSTWPPSRRSLKRGALRSTSRARTAHRGKVAFPFSPSFLPSPPHVCLSVCLLDMPPLRWLWPAPGYFLCHLRIIATPSSSLFLTLSSPPAVHVFHHCAGALRSPSAAVCCRPCLPLASFRSHRALPLSPPPASAACTPAALCAPPTPSREKPPCWLCAHGTA